MTDVGSITNPNERCASTSFIRGVDGLPADFCFIFPILIDQAFIIGLNLVNTAMISSSGVSAVSAVNMVDSLNIFLINVFVAVATGAPSSLHSIREAAMP